MRIFERWIILLLISVGMSACAGLPVTDTLPAAFAPEALRPLRICTSLAATQMNVQIALAEQLDAKYGLDFDVTVVNSASTVAAALVAGDFDICQNAGSAVVNAVAAGGELVIVGGVLNRQPYYLIVRPEIKQPSDLIGKALAVTGPGSSSDFAARTALVHLGLQADSDVAIVSIGGASERIAAMETGQVVGTILAPPEAMITVAQGYNILLDFFDLDKAYQHIAIITTRGFLNEHPDLVENYLKATSEAVALMHQDKALTLAVMADYLDLDPVTNAAEMELTYDMMIQKQMSVNPQPSLPGIQALIDDLARENPQVTNLKPADVVDLSMVEKLEDEGFFQTLQPTGN